MSCMSVSSFAMNLDLLIEVADEDGVACVAATREGKGVTVAGVSEVIDQIGFEVDDLQRPAAVERLAPEV